MALNTNALTTVARMRSHLVINDTLQDARLELFINAASQAIETYCNRKFKVNLYTETRNGNNQVYLLPDQFPVTSIAEVRTRTDLSTDWASADLVDPTTYTIVDNGQSVQFLYAFPKGQQNIRITYSAGYTDVPSDLELACIWAVEWFFKHRERGDTGRTSVSKSDESIGILASMPPMIMELVNQYKRVELPQC